MRKFKETEWQTNQSKERSVQSSREIKLISRIATGDHQAFAALFRKYRTLLYEMAHRIVQDEHEAEDVLQNVFLKIWLKGASQYNEALGRPFSWLFTITRNQAMNHLRRRRPVVPSSDALNAESMMAPEPTLPAEQAQKDIVAQVQALPECQRRAIELAFFHELTHKEISRTMGKPLGVIKTSIRRGMSRIRIGLADPDRNPGNWPARTEAAAPGERTARPAPRDHSGQGETACVANAR